MTGQTCDFCGAAFEWTPEQVAFDLQLRLFSNFRTSLGACCSACDDKQIAIAIKQERLDRRRERARERANG